MKRKRFGSRSRRYPRQWQRVLPWSLGALLGFAALVAVVYLFGNPASKDQDFFTSLHLAFEKPIVAALGATVATVWLAYCARRLLFERHAWWPGRVVVQVFSGPEATEGVDVIRLTESFRNRLVRSHLHSPEPVPAVAEQRDFLDVLTATNIDPANPFSTITGLLSAARPTHAYEVKGALSTRNGDDKPCGVTVRLERLPGKAGPGITVWDVDWESAITRAADHIAASILPRTRSCSSPWTAWRGYHLPPDLFNRYERAVELEEERRFDEALDYYYEALRRDPMNLGLRLQIGQLQEKLALFMDALATYDAMLAVVRPGRDGRGPFVEDGDETKLHAPDLALTSRTRQDRLGRFYSRRERRSRERILLIARYRRAILLGGAELPRQWCKPPRDPKALTKREEQRAALRERMGPSLKELFEEALESADVEWACRAGNEGVVTLHKPLQSRAGDLLSHGEKHVERRGRDELRAVLDLSGQGDHLKELEELCVFASIHELAELRGRVPHRLPFQERPPFTRDVVQLSRLCLRLRLRRVQGPGDAPSAEHEALSGKGLTDSVREIEGVTSFKRWQEHYNAACVYALPLLPGNGELDSTTRDELVRAALSRLERAIECADSGFVASRRDWLLSDDPDLDGLRTSAEFKRFEAAYFPSARRTRERPAGLNAWELSRYTLDLLSGTATCFAEAWDKRKCALEDETEIRSLADWCEVERKAWQHVGDVARNHQHWRTRVKLLEFARRLGGRSDFDPPHVAFPRFAELDDPRGSETGPWVEHNDERLAVLAKTIAEGSAKARSTPLIEDLALREIALGKVDGRGKTLRRPHVRALCEAHSDLWKAFAKSVEGVDRDVGPAELEDAITGLIDHWDKIKKRYLDTGPRAPRRPSVRRRSPAGVKRRVNGAAAARS